MAVEKQWLLQSIRDGLIPELARSGFSSAPLTGENARSPELRAAYPFGRMRRPQVSAIDQIEIQFDKHGRAAFRLNIGGVPREGVHHPFGFVAADDAMVHCLNRYGAMPAGSALRAWFTVRRWPWQKATQQDYHQLVEGVAGLLPELESFFQTHTGSRHVRLVEQ
jgi:hypothetical protein